MNKLLSDSNEPVNPGRRKFVKTLAAGSALAGLGVMPSLLSAADNRAAGPATLRGREFQLTIDHDVVNISGAGRLGTLVNGSLPAPILRWREGDEVVLNVTNKLPVTSSIHWHGMILPAAMDGVPGVSTDFGGIRPGETFRYRFKVAQSGTYWYHSHSGFQEQTGLYGAIVIDPKGREPIPADRDYVVMLSDWTDEHPETIYRKLKKLSHYYNFQERTHADLMRDIRHKGVAATWAERSMWNGMRMNSRDLADVTGYTYTYLMNGQAPGEGWTGLFKKGEKIRLRFINGSAMSFFDVRIPGLKMRVIAADGQDIEPVTVDEFRLGTAETIDVIVEPDADRAWTIFAQSLDRSGYARGTLTTDPAMTAEVPAMDSVPELSHADMGMGGMEGHDGHGSQDSHGGHGNQDSHGGHDQHSALAGLMLAAADHQGHGMPAMDHGSHDMATMDHSGAAINDDFRSRPVRHARSEYGPHVDMRADNPRYRLDDPGVGLRNNGRRVLTCADLRSRGKTADRRDPQREVELHLTGNMGRYMWSIDGVRTEDAPPLQWKYGERLRVILVNDTMMYHPMHLHGMWSELETGDDNALPRKHTIPVQPGSRISFQVTADARGAWAWHCHLLYHMPGMFRTVVVS